MRAKAEAAHAAGLTAVVCIGETGDERKAGTTIAVLTRQLLGSVPDGATAENTVIAYEPVWAIGTGLTPTAADVEEAMRRSAPSSSRALVTPASACASSMAARSSPPTRPS